MHIAYLRENLTTIDLICLDHDLGPSREIDGSRQDPGDGRDVANFLADQTVRVPLIIHTTNTPCGSSKKLMLETAGWKVAREVPFRDLEWIDGSWRREVKQSLGLPDHDD